MAATSSPVTALGDVASNRCCFKVPSTRSGMSLGAYPTAAMPFGMLISRIRLISTDGRNCESSAGRSVLGASSSAARRCRCGVAANVKRKGRRCRSRGRRTSLPWPCQPGRRCRRRGGPPCGTTWRAATSLSPTTCPRSGSTRSRAPAARVFCARSWCTCGLCSFPARGTGCPSRPRRSPRRAGVEADLVAGARAEFQLRRAVGEDGLWVGGRSCLMVRHLR